MLTNFQVDALRRAERAVTGWPEPSTKKLLSLFEAMGRGLVADTRAIRLLEAQIATGGLIDPRANHRVPIHIAYRRGLFDQQLMERLEDPNDDTKGFFDPNTQENLTYLELIRRCQKEPETGYHFLVLRQKRRREGRASRTSLWNASSMSSLHEAESMSRSSSRQSFSTKNYNQSNARSHTPESVKVATSKTSQIVEDDKTGKKYRETEEVITETRTRELTRKQIIFTTHTGVVNLHDLVESECCDSKTIRDLEKGKISLKQATASMAQYLDGFAPISGVLLTHGNGMIEEISLYDAELRGLIDNRLSFLLLEAQAATGGLCHPDQQKRFDLYSAFEQGLIDREKISELNHAISAVLGFVSKGRQIVTPMEAFRHGMISEEIVKRLLHVQVATGGIYDVHKSHRIPLSVAQKRCMWQNEWLQAIPKTYFFNGVNYSYQELLAHCCKPHSSSGIPLLCINGNSSQLGGAVRSVLNIPLKFYLESGLLNQKTFDAATSGYLTETDIENQLRRRLIGCEPISGIAIEGQKVAIWDAVRSNLIKPTQAIELLEAQVATTGALIDPINNGKIRLEAARDMGIIDYSTYDQLARTTCAHNGGKKKIPLATQMKKGVMAESKGARLLEVQLACGGIVEPETLLHFPLAAAIKKGLIDEELVRKMRKNKFFHDPESDERLSYLELCMRCVTDETGRASLPINIRGLPKGKKTKQRKRKIVVVDPETNEEMSTQVAFDRGLIDKSTFRDLLQQEGKSQEQIEELVEGKNFSTSHRIPVTFEARFRKSSGKFRVKYF